MAVNLVVAAELEDLADRLARLLADRPPGAGVAAVFAPEVVAVPSAGVESWLVGRLARQPLAPDGGPSVVAGVEVVFPSAIVSRALGRDQPSGVWPTIGVLTWAVFDALSGDADLAERFATQPGESLLARARSLADLFDRYLLHRPAMVRAWERSGPPSTPAAAGDQATLWRAVTTGLGVDVATAQEFEIGRLAAGDIEPDLPGRVSLFGVSALPALHREVLSALGVHRDVHLFAPVSSPEARRRLLDGGDPAVLLDSVEHPLVRSWSGANLEDHVVLAAMADGIEVIDAGDRTAPGLLGRVQAQVRADVNPATAEPAGLEPGDESVRWHGCFGPARQAEVVADAVRHLLQPSGGGAAPDFSDIVILCPDVAGYAPLVQAAFAGGDDVAEVPLAVTDLSLASTTPLVDVVVALLALLDGRFRPADVLAFASRPPVARRFGLSGADLADLAELTRRVNISWGVDPDQRAAYLGRHGGLAVAGSLGSRTWTEGIAQLLAGAVLADRPVHLAGDLPTVPLSGIEDAETVAAVGAFAQLLDVLADAVADLAAAQHPLAWSDRLAAAVEELVDLDDDDAWQWRRLESELASFAADAAGWSGATVAGEDIAQLFVGRLSATGGAARFGSGAVTLTSMTGLRGVPHGVVVLLGLDGDFATVGGRADDLLAVDRRPAEPQPQREVRAQLLDALLAARDRLLIVSTTVDPRSNKEVAPAVPLAELLAVLDGTVAGGSGGSGGAGGGVSQPASVAVAVHHPRHSWSTPNFSAGDDAPVPGARWGFDSAALAAARLREGVDGHGAGRSPRMLTPADDSAGWTALGPDPGFEPAVGEVTVAQLGRALRNPAQTFLSERLGIRLPDDRMDVVDGLVDLKPKGLDRYHLSDELWDLVGPASSVVDGPEDRGALAEAWRDGHASRGALPPSPYLEETFADIDHLVEQLADTAAEAAAGRPIERVQLSVALSCGVVVVGEADVARGGDDSVVLDVRPARRKDGEDLAALVLLAAVAAQFPGERWQLLQLRPASGAGVDAARIRLRNGVDGAEVLAWAVDYRDHARAGFFPALPATLGAVWAAVEADGGGDLGRARTAWGESDVDGASHRRGDRVDRWVAVLGETPEFEALWALAPTAVEADWLESMPSGSPLGSRRLGVWSHQLWGRAQSFAKGLAP